MKKDFSSSRCSLSLLVSVLSLLLVAFLVYSYTTQGGLDFSRLSDADGDGRSFSGGVPANGKDPAVKSHKKLGGIDMSRPCCVSWGPDRVDCFVRSDDGNVHHWWKEDDQEHDWESICGTIIGDLECVSRGVGHIDIMARGTNNALWTKTYSGYWGQWTSRGGIIMERPSCVARTPTTVNCMIRSTDNGAYHIGHTNDRWGGYGKRGGILEFPIAASHRGPNALNFFGIGTNNALFNMYWTPKGWSGWASVGGAPVHGRPVAVSGDGVRLDVFVMGVASRLKHLVWDGKKWLPWEDLGGKLKDVPSCVANKVGVHCFGIGPGSHLYRRSFVKGKWGSWVRSYGPFQETPSCVFSNENEVSCYLQDYEREVVEIIFAV